MSDPEAVNESTKPESTPNEGQLPPCRTWNADQVGARLGCSGRHVLRMADAGKMPWGFKIGALRRWDAEEVDRWIGEGGNTISGGAASSRTFAGQAGAPHVFSSLYSMSPTQRRL